MNTHLLDNMEKSTEALLQQQKRLKDLCKRLQQERETLLAKNQEATKRIQGILEKLRQQGVRSHAYYETEGKQS